MPLGWVPQGSGVSWEGPARVSGVLGGSLEGPAVFLEGYWKDPRRCPARVLGASWQCPARSETNSDNPASREVSIIFRSKTRMRSETSLSSSKPNADTKVSTVAELAVQKSTKKIIRFAMQTKASLFVFSAFATSFFVASYFDTSVFVTSSFATSFLILLYFATSVFVSSNFATSRLGPGRLLGGS